MQKGWWAGGKDGGREQEQLKLGCRGVLISTKQPAGIPVFLVSNIWRAHFPYLETHMLLQLSLACQCWPLQKRKGDRILWCIVRSPGTSSTACLQPKNGCNRRKYCKREMKGRLSPDRGLEMQRKTVQASTSSSLSKEHEMNCARIIRKNLLPPLGSEKDSAWQRGWGLLLRKKAEIAELWTSKL